MPALQRSCLRTALFNLLLPTLLYVCDWLGRHYDQSYLSYLLLLMCIILSCSLTNIKLITLPHWRKTRVYTTFWLPSFIGHENSWLFHNCMLELVASNNVMPLYVLKKLGLQYPNLIKLCVLRTQGKSRSMFWSKTYRKDLLHTWMLVSLMCHIQGVCFSLGNG